MVDIPGIVPEFSRPFALDKLPAKGKHFRLEATAAESEALCKRFGLLALEGLKAEVFVEPVNGISLVRLKGQLTADVIQECVATLKPLPVNVDESFTLMYADSDTVSSAEAREIDFDMDDVDSVPEPITGGVIDLGEAVAEHLMLALDPFPRCSDEIAYHEEDNPEDLDEEPRNSPFETLAALTKKKH